MKKEIKYIAPQAEILSAEIEKGFAASNPDGNLNSGEDTGWGEW